MAVNLEKKESIVKGDWCHSTKDPSMIKSVFSLEHKERE